MDQAEAYLNTLPEEELPRLIVLSDFARFRVLNLETTEEIEFALEELPEHIEMFTFLAGYRPRWFEDQAEVNVKAARLMGRIYDRLAENGYEGAQLNLLLVRLVFLMFADDTGLWGETGLFEDYIERKTDEDGSDLGPRLGQLFELLDTPMDKRQSAIEESLKPFPYVNGHLFSDQLPLAAFDQETREQLLLACRFNWSKISPAIFGSMFQSVMDAEERRSIGAHYTTEQNIMKTIGPLFVDELEERLEKAGQNKAKLTELFEDLRQMTFFDPACGSGNFLVISYRELRRIELEVLKRLRKLNKKVAEGQLAADASLLSHVDVDQFYGIEIEEFPARIAEVAMYLMDHLANQKLGEEFGLTYSRIPLHSPAHIHVGNALELDWNAVLPRSECSYLFGNPPFIGALRLSDEQKADRKRVFADIPEAKDLRTGRLDYVLCWYGKALQYMAGTQTRAAFVSTNSISQGEQGRSLAPLLLRLGYEIDFAHRTFAWTSEARGSAAVHVVIVGFSEHGLRAKKLLFDYPDPKGTPLVREAKNINAWLLDAPSVILEKRAKPIPPGMPVMTVGSQPTDGGNLVVTPDQYAEVAEDPIAVKYLHPLIGAEGMLNGHARWCLWLVDAPPEDLRNSTVLRSRINAVRELRAKSPTESFRKCPPHLFTHRKQPTTDWIAIPRHSSEFRRIVPMEIFESDEIAHDSLMIVKGAPLWLFTLLQSAAFMAWARIVCGRLESRIRISADLAYNAFPFPDLNERAKERLTASAEALFAARAGHTGATLADLYDPLSTPADLSKAHDDLDRIVDGLYGLGKGTTESGRAGRLFEFYEAMSEAEVDAPSATR